MGIDTLIATAVSKDFWQWVLQSYSPLRLSYTRSFRPLPLAEGGFQVSRRRFGGGAGNIRNHFAGGNCLLELKDVTRVGE